MYVDMGREITFSGDIYGWGDFQITADKWTFDGEGKVALWMDEVGVIHKKPIVGFLEVNSDVLPDFIKYKAALTNAHDLRLLLDFVKTWADRYLTLECETAPDRLHVIKASLRAVLLPALLQQEEFVVPERVRLGLYHPHHVGDDPGWLRPAQIIEAEPTIGDFAPFTYEDMAVDLAKYSWLAGDNSGKTTPTEYYVALTCFV